MFRKYNEGVQSQYRDDTHEPSYRKDADQGDFLSLRNLQSPESFDRQYSDHQVREDVDARVDEPKATKKLAPRNMHSSL